MTKNILFLDSDSSCLKSNMILAESLGYEAFGVWTTEDAKKYLGKKFDVVIMDGRKRKYLETFSKINSGRKIIASKGDSELVRDAIYSYRESKLGEMTQ
jgi:hypothetical protein